MALRTPGLIGPHRESHEPSLLAHNFVEVEAAPTYVEWDGTHGITDWGMDCNGPDLNNPTAFPNGLGDCGAAATDHGNIAKTGNRALLNTLGHPKFQGTVSTYWAYGVSMGEVGQPPASADEPDEGVANNTWLNFLWKNGVIDGYVEVPVEDMDKYGPIGSGLLIGVQLPDAAQDQFANHQPWDGSPNPQLGHDVWYVKGHLDGSGAAVTWGAIQPFTLNFRRNNITDAWLITDSNDPKVDDAALQQALQALHGTGTV